MHKTRLPFKASDYFKSSCIISTPLKHGLHSSESEKTWKLDNRSIHSPWYYTKVGDLYKLEYLMKRRKSHMNGSKVKRLVTTRANSVILQSFLVASSSQRRWDGWVAERSDHLLLMAVVRVVMS